MQNRFPRNVSLDAMRVFEVAARRKSLTLAAKELFVTQVAISKRIKGLEQQLGFDLFIRSGRRIELTDRGERLAARIETALTYLATEINALHPERDATEIAISAAASVSQLWLSPKLHEILQEHPTLNIVLNTTDRLSDLEKSPDAISILYSSGGHPDWSMTLLFPEELVPVASPFYLERCGLLADGTLLSPHDLMLLDCFDYRRANASWLTLRMWFKNYLPDHPVPTMKVTFSNYGTAVDAALAGKGVVLGSRHMLADAIGRGALIELTDCVHVTGKGYYIGLPKARPISEETLIVWKTLTP